MFPTGFVKVKFDDGSTDVELVKNVTADSIAAAQDAKFKVGDKVKRGDQIGVVKDIEKEPYIEVKFRDEPITLFVHERELKIFNPRAGDSIADKEREYTRLYELAQKNITFYAAKGDSAKVAEWKRKADEYKRLAQEAENAAMDAAPQKGDRVFWRNGPFKFEGIFLEERGGRALVKTDRGDILVNGKVYVEGQTPTYHDTPFGRIYD